MIMQSIVKMLSVTCTVGLLTSCVSSGSKVEINPAIHEDRAYMSVLERHHFDAEAHRHFATHFFVGATLLSPAMRSAIGDRYERLYGARQPIFQEASERTGFIVSVYVTNLRYHFLDDESQWMLLLSVDGATVQRPAIIKYLPEKPRLTPFFPSVNTWTRDYLVLFDTPTPPAADQELLKKDSIVLTISNADASVKFSW
jgi:hypothetical protein